LRIQVHLQCSRAEIDPRMGIMQFWVSPLESTFRILEEWATNDWDHFAAKILDSDRDLAENKISIFSRIDFSGRKCPRPVATNQKRNRKK
jgi:hypothetical protein